MRDLVAAVDPWMPDEQEWGPAAGDVAALRDVDTPDDLRQLGWTVVE
jgi:hypothetical protein